MEVSVKVFVVAFAWASFDGFEALFSLLLDQRILCFHAMSLVEGIDEAFCIRHDDGVGIDVGTRFLRCYSVDDCVVYFDLNDVGHCGLHFHVGI